MLDQADDSSTTAISDAEEGEDGEGSDPETDLINYYREVVLFSREHYLGQRKTMNIVYDKGMKIEARALHYDDDDNVVREEELAVFELPELDDIMKYDVV